MDENKRRQKHHDHHDNPSRVTENLKTRVNKSYEDLDEKSSAMGRTDNGRSSGLSSKDGLTGSDYDGQVTR